MKPIKMLSLAVSAALMTMAFLGASSATAETTALCGTDEEECASPITHVHVATLAGQKAVVKTNLWTIECDVLFLGDVLEGLVEEGPVVIHGSFTYTNCGACTLTEENGPAEIKVLAEGLEIGSVTGEGLVHLECSGGLNCRYNGVGLKATAQGALFSTETNGRASLANQTVNRESGLFCPSTSKLTISVTPLSIGYLSS